MAVKSEKQLGELKQRSEDNVLKDCACQVCVRDVSQWIVGHSEVESLCKRSLRVGAAMKGSANGVR